ncbi:hypothetical protein PMAYCL1PPCAC_29672, partial [Pristionchus mayeri]
MEKVVMLIIISVIGILCSSAMIILIVTLCSVLRANASDEESLLESSSIALHTPILPTRKLFLTRRAATIE